MKPEHRRRPGPAPTRVPAPWISEDSIWQLVEGGSYRIDLPAWRRIAADSGGKILDLGCGIGRVSHHLAGSGHRVNGLELDPGIAADFSRLSPGETSAATVGDALQLDRAPLPRARYHRILAPQQLLQILGGAGARARLLAGVKSRLAPRGVAAFAITEELPGHSIELDLEPDRVWLSGWEFTSAPVSIEASRDWIELTRIRRRLGPAGAISESASVVRFDRLTADGLAGELETAGLVQEETIAIPPTPEHTASTIITARVRSG